MAVQAIPLLAAAGAALLLSGGKKKKRSSKAGQKCDTSLNPPTGFSCDDGFLKEESVDESELDSDSDLSKEESGDFETSEEDVGIGAEEDDSEPEDEEPAPLPDPAKTCEEFMKAIHVKPTEEGEIPINAVAVEEAVLPAMRSAAAGLAESLGLPLDLEAVSPSLVVTGLKTLIPVCEWKYDVGEGFTYNDGSMIVSDEAKDVIFGLIELSVSVIEEINIPEPQNATLQPQG